MSRARSRPNIERSSDAEALMRVANGDVAAIADVYDRHAGALLQFASRLMGRIDAEDIVHSVFIRVTRTAATYDNRAVSARSWLFGITSHVIQERRRSLGRTLRAMLRISSAGAPGQAPSIGDRCDINRGLAVLSDVQRVVLVLSDVEGFRGEEIARMLHVPVGTVWTRLHHARRKLREYLGEDSRT